MTDTDIISSYNIVAYLKLNHNEYARRQKEQFEAQIKRLMEEMYSETNTTNIKKSFYRRKDLLKGQEEDPESGK